MQYQLIWVSTSPLDSQRDWAIREDLGYTLISDTKLELARILGLPTRKVTGARVYKSMTLVAHDGELTQIFFPVDPGQDAHIVVRRLRRGRMSICDPDIDRGRSVVPSNAELGRAIRRLRLTRCLTIEDLASRADMDPTYLSKIEMGVRNPTWHKLGTLSEALGFLMSRIVEEAEADARDSIEDTFGS